MYLMPEQVPGEVSALLAHKSVVQMASLTIPVATHFGGNVAAPNDALVLFLGLMITVDVLVWCQPHVSQRLQMIVA